MARIIVWMEPLRPSHGLRSKDYCEAEDDKVLSSKLELGKL